MNIIEIAARRTSRNGLGASRFADRRWQRLLPDRAIHLKYSFGRAQGLLGRPGMRHMSRAGGAIAPRLSAVLYSDGISTGEYYLVSRKTGKEVLGRDRIGHALSNIWVTKVRERLSMLAVPFG